MPILSGLLISLFGSLSGFFMSWLTLRVARVVAVITMISGLTAALWLTLSTSLAAIAVAVPSEVVIGASWVAPPNLIPCISVIISARIARWAYDQTRAYTQMTLL